MNETSSLADAEETATARRAESATLRIVYEGPRRGKADGGAKERKETSEQRGNKSMRAGKLTGAV